jgi:hypothetical protein
MKRWRSGCDGMIAVNSIFASFTGALVAIVVALSERSPLIQVCVFLLLIAFLLFAHAAESITDAIERDDVLLYQRSHFRYNLGVVLILISFALILWSLEYRIATFIPLAGTWNPWLRDCIWLLRRPKDDWDTYLESITSEDE